MRQMGVGLCFVRIGVRSGTNMWMLILQAGSNRFLKKSTRTLPAFSLVDFGGNRRGPRAEGVVEQIHFPESSWVVRSAESRLERLVDALSFGSSPACEAKLHEDSNPLMKGWMSPLLFPWLRSSSF